MFGLRGNRTRNEQHRRQNGCKNDKNIRYKWWSAHRFTVLVGPVPRQLSLVLPLVDHPDHLIRVRREHGARHHRVVRLYTLPEVVPVPPHGRELRVVVISFPYTNALVLRAGDDVLSIVREGRLYLTGDVHVALVLAGEVQVPEIVEADPAVVGGDEDLVVVGHGLDAADLAAGGVLPARGAHVDLRVVLQLVGRVEYAAAVVRAHDRELAVLTEVRRGYQFRFAVHFVPHSHLK